MEGRGWVTGKGRNGAQKPSEYSRITSSKSTALHTVNRKSGKNAKACMVDQREGIEACPTRGASIKPRPEPWVREEQWVFVFLDLRKAFDTILLMRATKTGC